MMYGVMKIRIEAVIRKSINGYDKNGKQYIAGKIVSTELNSLIGKRVKIKVEVIR